MSTPNQICPNCRHQAHLGLCTSRSGGTTYACMCSTQALPNEAGPRPSHDQLREIARRIYGTSCSQRFCKAGVGDRDLDLPDDLRVERDDALEGTWVTARIWIPDDALDKEIP